MDNATAKTLERFRQKMAMFEAPDTLKKWSVELWDGDEFIVSRPVVNVSRHECLLKLRCEDYEVDRSLQHGRIVVRDERGRAFSEDKLRYWMGPGDVLRMAYSVWMEEKHDMTVTSECRGCGR